MRIAGWRIRPTRSSSDTVNEHYDIFGTANGSPELDGSRRSCAHLCANMDYACRGGIQPPHSGAADDGDAIVLALDCREIQPSYRLLGVAKRGVDRQPSCCSG